MRSLLLLMAVMSLAVAGCQQQEPAKSEPAKTEKKADKPAAEKAGDVKPAGEAVAPAANTAETSK